MSAVLNKILNGESVRKALIENMSDADKRQIKHWSAKVNYDIAIQILSSLSKEKKIQLDKMLTRNLMLTSSYSCSSGNLRIYKQGWYLTLNATRSGFSVWMFDRDGEFEEARKPIESKLDFLYEQHLHFNSLGEGDWHNFTR